MTMLDNETEYLDDKAEAPDNEVDDEDRDTEPSEGGSREEECWRQDPVRQDEPVARVAVDWIELEGALENNSPELHSFLNKVTGDVSRIFRGSEDSEMRLREAENDSDFVYIEPISSREQYRWMEEFIEITEEPNLKDKLNIAIDGKGAFRRFKDVLVGYPIERERWFAKRSVKLRTHIVEWLAAKRIEPINTPPWDEEGNVFCDDADSESGDEHGGRESTADLRQIAHDMVDLVPSRELPSAVAFLEFLRSRRGSKRYRHG